MAGDTGDDDSGSYEAPRDVADVGVAGEAARDRGALPSPVMSAPSRPFEASHGDEPRPAQSVAAPPPREPESRSFDFERPPSPAASPPSHDREREPAAVATAAEPREWTPTPPTDTPTPRSEP